MAPKQIGVAHIASLILIAPATAATFNCTNAETGHAYVSSQGVPGDSCKRVSEDDPYAQWREAERAKERAASQARIDKILSADRRAKSRRAKLPGASIGMSEKQVLATAWGKPAKINRTITARGTSEQWVYGGNNYLYFQDGVLVTIQN